MLRRHSQPRTALLLAGDLLATAASLVAAYLLRFASGLFGEPRPYVPGRYLEALPPAVLLALATYAALGRYRPPWGEGAGGGLRGAVRAALAATLLLAAGALLYRDQYQFSRGVLVAFPLLAAFLLWGGRRLAERLLLVLHDRGIGVSRALLVGRGAGATRLEEALRERRWSGIRIAARLPSTDGLAEALEAHRPSQVFLAFPAADHNLVREAAEALSREMVDVRLVPDLGGEQAQDAVVVGGLPVLTLSETPFYGFRRILKRGFDLLVGGLLLVLALPVLTLVAGLILVCSGRPVLYRQERMGLDGRRFSILKFRTMRPDAEEATGAVWASRADPRRTSVGRWLRRFSLDELPQLLNVVRGDMSLVGPRPERPVLIERFREELPRYMLRHRIPAGLTGWAQIHGLRGDTDLAERLGRDLEYLRRWSLLLDLEILLRTVWHVLRGQNAG